jgi:hypothetical protein
MARVEGKTGLDLARPIRSAISLAARLDLIGIDGGAGRIATPPFTSPQILPSKARPFRGAKIVL